MNFSKLHFIENMPPSMIDNIRGKQTIKTQYQWAFVLASGLCQVVKMDLTDKYAHIILRRISQNWSYDFEKKITIDDLKAKGLTRNPVYKTYPLQMLQWRCIGDLIKLGFPDCVLGLPQYTQEELVKDDHDVIIDDTTFDSQDIEEDQDIWSDQTLIDGIYETQFDLDIEETQERNDRAMLQSFLNEVKPAHQEKLYIQRFGGYNWRTYQELIGMLNQNMHPMILIRDLLEGLKTVEGTDPQTLKRYLETGSLVGPDGNL